MTYRKNNTHGMSGTIEHITWMRMKSRCYNPNYIQYADYGGRGIEVCSRWINSFVSFLSDMGEKPIGYQLDRIDNDLSYSPENCRWATPRQQANNKRNNRLLSFNGKTLTMSQWSRRTGIKVGTIWYRLKSGWSDERVLTECVDTNKRNKSYA
jgi:hypothetical protein